MHWMRWVRKQPEQIMTRMPFFKSRAGKKKKTGWLIDRNGYLRAAKLLLPAGNMLSDLSANQVKVYSTSVLSVHTFAGGMRPAGAARLNGVLHYFTRGPDGIL